MQKHNQGSRFWWFQCLGWGLFAISNFVAQFALGGNSKTIALNVGLTFLPGLLVTSAFRQNLRRYAWSSWPIGRLLALVFGGAATQTIGLLLLVLALLYVLDISMSGADIAANAFVFFVLLLSWTSIYVGAHFVKLYSRTEVERLRLEAAMREAELASLRAQVNPHFTFNALNNIRALITVDPSRARLVLDDFADLLRYSLKHGGADRVGLAEELLMVRRYLDIMAIQYEERLQTSFEIEAGLETIQVPALLLQTLVENAVKHGLERSAQGGRIDICIARVPTSVDSSTSSLVSKTQVLITVGNTGALAPPAPPAFIEASNRPELGKTRPGATSIGLGLSNVRRRLQLLYGAAASFTIAQVQPDYVLASVQIPLR